MKEITVTEIVADWLKAHECDGLCHTGCECGCPLDDFAPCLEPSFDCVAAVKGPVPKEYEGGTDTWMVPKPFPEGAKNNESRFVDLTHTERAFLAGAISFIYGQGRVGPNYRPLIGSLLEKLDYDERPLAKGETDG
jgi:hypothetical protein